MAANFFISYSRSDPDSVALATALHEKLGPAVFLDVESLRAGEDWEPALKKAIKECDEFVLLLSALAAESKEVLEELRIADYAEAPRVTYVRVNHDAPLTDELERRLGGKHYLAWHSPADTPRVVSRIQRDAAARRLPRILFAAALIVIAIVAALLFAYVRRQVATVSNAASSEEAAVAAYRRLRTAEGLVVPRLWLRGERKPQAMMQRYFEAHARSLDAEAAKLFESGEREQVREKVDQALYTWALAALKRGAKPSPEAERVYARENYDRLVTTMNEPQELGGVGLSVWTGASRWRIAAARDIWTCSQPIGERPCELTKQSGKVFVIASAFRSDDEVYLVDNSGDVVRLRLDDKSTDQSMRSNVTALAGDDGEVATAFEPRSTSRDDPSVIVEGAGTAQINSPNLGAIDNVTFGPCPECVTLLTSKNRVSVWRRNSGTATPLGVTAIAIAGTRGGRLAVVRSDGRLEFWRASLIASPGPNIDLKRTTALAMSKDGQSVAVVHASAVTIIVGDAVRTLVRRELGPSTVAVTFATNDLLITRTLRQTRIWRLASPQPGELTPHQRWAEWGKQLGLLAAREGHDGQPGFGWDPAAADVRRY